MDKSNRKRIASLDDGAQNIPAAVLQVQKRKKEFGLLPSDEESSINNLPSEVLKKIFSNITQDELVTLCDVCSLWKTIIYEYFSKTPLRSLEFSETTLRLMKGNSPSTFNCVTMIDAVLSNSSSAVNLITVLSRMQNGNLRKLHITIAIPWPRAGEEGWTMNVTWSTRSLGNLESFQYIDSRNEMIPLLNALLLLVSKTNRGTVKHFRLEGVCADAHEYLAVHVRNAIEAHQSSLTHVTLRDCCFKDNMWEPLIHTIPTLTHLHSLDLQTAPTHLHYLDSGAGEYRALAVHLSIIKALHTSRTSDNDMPEKIMLNGLTIKAGDDMSMIKFVTSFEGFYISPDLSTEDLNSLVSCLQDHCLPHVRRFGIIDEPNEPDEGTTNFTDDILASIIQCLPGVKGIFAGRCHFLTDEGLVNIITSAPTVERILVDSCEGLTPALRHLLSDVTVPMRDHSNNIVSPGQTPYNLFIRAAGSGAVEGLDPAFTGYTTGRNRDIYIHDHWIDPPFINSHPLLD